MSKSLFLSLILIIGIATLANGEFEVGKHEIEFNASNLPSGVYFYNLTSSTNSITKKMLLLK